MYMSMIHYGMHSKPANGGKETMFNKTLETIAAKKIVENNIKTCISKI